MAPVVRSLYAQELAGSCRLAVAHIYIRHISFLLFDETEVHGGKWGLVVAADAEMPRSGCEIWVGSHRKNGETSERVAVLRRCFLVLSRQSVRAGSIEDSALHGGSRLLDRHASRNSLADIGRTVAFWSSRLLQEEAFRVLEEIY